MLSFREFARNPINKTTDIVFRSFSSTGVSETNAIDLTPCLLDFQDGGFHHEDKTSGILF